MALTKAKASNILLTTPAASSNDVTPATTEYVTTALANMVDSAPSTLNTLNELAAALGDDANFSTTVTNSIATKLPLAGGTMTGNITSNESTFSIFNNDFRLKSSGAETMLRAQGNGAVEIMHDNSTKLTTTSTGISVTGTLTSTGYVGVGASPSSGLHLTGGSNIASKLTLTNTAPSPDNTWSLHPIYNGQDLLLNEDSDTRVTFKSGGNVGIGTNNPPSPLSIFGAGVSSPTASNAQESYDNALFRINNFSNSSVGLSIGSTGSNVTHIQTSYNEGTTSPLTLNPFGGNVGIGTTAVTSPGLWYDATNDYLAISHWSNNTPPTPAAMLHLSDNSNNIDVPQIRIEGRDNPGDTKLDISVKDTTARLNVIEGATDASNGYGLMEFKTNAASNASANLRGGFKFITPSDANNLVITNTGRVFIGHSSADGTGDKLGVSGSIGISPDGYIGAGSGFGPSNGAGSSSTIQLYSSATGNMSFSANYSAADIYFNMGGASKFIIKRSAAGTEAIQLYTQDGGIRIGALNGSYHHFMRLSGPSLYYFDNPAQASGGFSTYSDERLKEEITTITGALDKVAVMNGVTFKWKDAAKRGGGDAGKQFGVLAQNMLEVDSELPKLNVDPLETQENIDDDSKDTDYYSMDYSRITPFLIEAIKELKEKLETAEARITELEG